MPLSGLSAGTVATSSTSRAPGGTGAVFAPPEGGGHVPCVEHVSARVRRAVTEQMPSRSLQPASKHPARPSYPQSTAHHPFPLRRTHSETQQAPPGTAAHTLPDEDGAGPRGHESESKTPQRQRVLVLGRPMSLQRQL